MLQSKSQYKLIFAGLHSSVAISYFVDGFR
jgi:hypothetical protein